MANRDVLDRVVARWATTVDTSVRAVEPLGGGYANTVARVSLADGHSAIVKLAPPPAACLTHERRLLRTEAYALRELGRAEVPQPRLLAEFGVDGRDVIVVTELEGVPAAGAGVDPAAIGRVLAALHEAGQSAAGTGPVPVFGYPFREDLQAPSAREAYLMKVDAVLADARRFQITLPVDPIELRARLVASSAAFDDVRQPTLVHFDLWDGNLLVDGGCITGVIDHERAMWADPTADFASRALFLPVPEAIDGDFAFRSAYRTTIGRDPIPDAAGRTRTRLWAVYLALIMVVEAAPRAYSGDWFSEHDGRARRWLVDTAASLG